MIVVITFIGIMVGIILIIIIDHVPSYRFQVSALARTGNDCSPAPECKT